jgi:drug/metabolite transporter (DMT)-like permease
VYVGWHASTVSANAPGTDEWGITDGFHDVHGTWHPTTDEVRAALRDAMGTPVATEPLWIAMFMPADGTPLWSLRMAGGLAAGLIGVGLLVPPEALAAGSQQLWGSSAVLLGAMSWALGVRYSATAPLPRDPFVRASTTLLCGAALLLASSLLTGELRRVDVHAISGRSLLGLAYLIVFGSVVAFSAYTWLLERCSATLVATHTYVNPVIAVLLGWLFVSEPLTMRIVLATGLILSAVLLLKSASSRRPAAQCEELSGAPARAGAVE